MADWNTEKRSRVSPFINMWENIVICRLSGIALYTAKENPERILYGSCRHDKDEDINT